MKQRDYKQDTTLFCVMHTAEAAEIKNPAATEELEVKLS
jgi:hypothetical protein